MQEIKYNTSLSAEENARTAFDAINALIRDRNTGQGWETQVKQQRDNLQTLANIADIEERNALNEIKQA